MAATSPEPGVLEGHFGTWEFETDREKVKLVLSEENISWSTLDENTSVVLEWRDVIRCHRGRVTKGSPDDVTEGGGGDGVFSVHYIEKQKDHVWKHQWKTFTGSNNIVSDIVSSICKKSKEDHPSRLLVLINPVGGTGKGAAHYANIVAPLFKLAQIDTEVIVSENPDHPGELGKSYDFSSVDGVVVAGGDGTLQKLLHTWLPRVQREAEIDTMNPASKLKPLTCPVGMIPTGTGNGLARGSYGCKDIATAALNIITGRRSKKNLMAVSSGGQHVGFSGIVLASGLWCDILGTGLEARWLGWLRYPVSVIGLFLKSRREFDLELEYLPYIPGSDEEGNSLQTEENEWKKVEGTYTGVFAFPGLFASDAASGMVKVQSNTEGVTLTLEKQCGRFKYFSWMFKIINFRQGMLEQDFLTPLTVKAYRYRIVHREGDEDEYRRRQEKTVNFDGELLHLDTPEISVRNHKNMMELFGTGVLF